MSTWTNEKHEQARRLARPDLSPIKMAATLNECLDELERLRPALAGPAPTGRDEQVHLFAQRLWTAAAEVAGDEVPPLEELDSIEIEGMRSVTDAVLSAMAVLLSRRHAAVPRPSGSEGEVP